MVNLNPRLSIDENLKKNHSNCGLSMDTMDVIEYDRYQSIAKGDRGPLGLVGSKSVTTL